MYTSQKSSLEENIFGNVHVYDTKFPLRRKSDWKKEKYKYVLEVQTIKLCVINQFVYHKCAGSNYQRH